MLIVSEVLAFYKKLNIPRLILLHTTDIGSRKTMRKE